jgi:XTP/dITP diphosphohydrolase
MIQGAVVVATRNPGKLREIRQALAPLGVQVEGLETVTDVPEPAEDGQTFAENARAKALYYARATGRWCLADDSGLMVDVLGGAPGVRSARYAGARCPPDADRATIDAANNARLLEELQHVPDEACTARFVCHLALADPQRVLVEASGAVEGRIARTPRGANGFGYDPLFYVSQMGCTTAEMSADAKNRISHRGQAVRRFAVLLGDLLAHRNR